MTIDQIAIVVVAYNRYDPFRRLLKSISAIQTSQRDIPLIISIDYHRDNNNIIEYAESFNWEYGQKQIIVHKDKKGLRNHIISCGNLTKKFESVIILEDDLYVSPFFYEYTKSIINFYYDEPKISGFSLYAYERAESANFFFKPLYDGYDTYFMQFPSSWGQCWLKNQWEEFIEWLEENNLEGKIKVLLPEFVRVWPSTSWKKYFVAFLIDRDKYFVYPKVGLSTNFGEKGQHHVNQLNIRQVELLSKKMSFNFPKFHESNAKYDFGFELKYEELIKLNSKIKEYPKFDIDFYCRKSHNKNDLILTIAKSRKTIHNFSGKLTPLINNVIFNIPGEDVIITKFKDVKLESIGIYKETFFAELKFLIREILRLIYNQFFFNKNKPNIN